MQLFHFQKGFCPIVLFFPTSGTFIPLDIRQRLDPSTIPQRSLDWQLPKLFDATPIDQAAFVAANLSPVVVALLAKPESIVSLNPASMQKEPTSNLRYLPGQDPDAEEIELRRVHFYQPIVDQAQMELDRLAQQFGSAVLVTVLPLGSESAERPGDADVAMFSASQVAPALIALANQSDGSIQWDERLMIPEGCPLPRNPDKVISVNVAIRLGRFLDEDGVLAEASQQNWVRTWTPIHQALLDWTQQENSS